jgi:hypothetical protein
MLDIKLGFTLVGVNAVDFLLNIGQLRVGKPGNMLSYAKIGMKAKTFESRVFEMEYSSLKTEY